MSRAKAKHHKLSFSDSSDNEPSPIIPFIKKNSRTNKENAVKRRKRSEHQNERQYKNHKTFQPLNCISDFIGPQRLTHKLGIFQRGKISGKVTRLEDFVSEEVQARAKQDLHKILNISNGKVLSTNKRPTSPEFKEPRVNHHIEENLSQTSSCTLLKSRNRLSTHSKKNYLEPNNNGSGVSYHRKSILSSLNSHIVKPTPLQETNEVVVASSFINNKVHRTIQDSNKQLFPKSSLKDELKQELLNLKTRRMDKNAIIHQSLSTSENISVVVDESPQSIMSSMMSGIKKKDEVPFQLKICAELTRKNVTNKHAIFPTIDEFFLKPNETFLEHIRSVSLTPNSHDSKEYRRNSCCPDVEDSSFTLVPGTPDSDGTPVWMAKVSPVKFPPISPPTPRLYFRQRMY